MAQYFQKGDVPLLAWRQCPRKSNIEYHRRSLNASEPSNGNPAGVVADFPKALAPWLPHIFVHNLGIRAALVLASDEQSTQCACGKESTP